MGVQNTFLSIFSLWLLENSNDRDGTFLHFIYLIDRTSRVFSLIQWGLGQQTKKSKLVTKTVNSTYRKPIAFNKSNKIHINSMPPWLRIVTFPFMECNGTTDSSRVYADIQSFICCNVFLESSVQVHCFNWGVNANWNILFKNLYLTNC